MRGLLAAALLLASQILSCGAAAASGAAHARIVGYATDWDPAEDAQAGKIDTLIFAFAQVAEGRVTLDQAAQGRLARLMAVKAAHPALKVAISVGGWGAGGFSEAAGSAAGRQMFADSAAQLLGAHGADGLDVDWEYPGHDESGIHAGAQDRVNFTLLLESVRASLDRAGAAHGREGARRYTLSIAAADGPFVSGIDIPAVAPLLDWFNLMTYDFVNSQTPYTGHHSGLRGRPDCTRRRAHGRARGAAVPERRRARRQTADRRGVLWARVRRRAGGPPGPLPTLRPLSGRDPVAAARQGLHRQKRLRALLGRGSAGAVAVECEAAALHQLRRSAVARGQDRLRQGACTWAASCTGSRARTPAANCSRPCGGDCASGRLRRPSRCLTSRAAPLPALFPSSRSPCRPV